MLVIQAAQEKKSKNNHKPIYVLKAAWQTFLKLMDHITWTKEEEEEDNTEGNTVYKFTTLTKKKARRKMDGRH